MHHSYLRKLFNQDLFRKWRNAPFLLQRLLHKENEAERILFIEQIKQMDCIVAILTN